MLFDVFLASHRLLFDALLVDFTNPEVTPFCVQLLVMLSSDNLELISFTRLAPKRVVLDLKIFVSSYVSSLSLLFLFPI